MSNEFIMEAYPMSKQEIRELSCEEHKGQLMAQCLEQKVILVCKHCRKVMAESDDPKLFDLVLKKELRGD